MSAFVSSQISSLIIVFSIRFSAMMIGMMPVVGLPATPKTDDKASAKPLQKQAAAEEKQQEPKEEKPKKKKKVKKV